MRIRDFAKRYYLPLQADNSGIAVIKGKLGYIYEYSTSELGVVICPNGSNAARCARYIIFRTQCCSVGMKVRQDCYADGVLSFNPKSRRQARMAIKVAKVLREHRISRGRKAKFLKCPCNGSPKKEVAHQHSCDDCGKLFLCECGHCGLGKRHVCETCENDYQPWGGFFSEAGGAQSTNKNTASLCCSGGGYVTDSRKRNIPSGEGIRRSRITTAR